jgi:hypothetical protein
MVRLLTRIRSFSFILSLLAVLAMGISVGPSQALARPVPIMGGPDGSGTGDPTGDDLPSPTPKPTSLQTAPMVQTTRTVAVRGISTSVRWNLFLSILVRLGLR